MEMPTPCQYCNEWFDLDDGYTSTAWCKNTIICPTCGRKEEEEIELDEEIEELTNEIEDFKITISDTQKMLKEAEQKLTKLQSKKQS